MGPKAQLELGTVTAESTRFRRPSRPQIQASDPIPMEIDRRLDHNTKLPSALSVLLHRTHGVPDRKGTSISTHGHSSTPEANAKRRGLSADNSVACQGALVGDTSDDEQWGDNLCNPPSH